MAVPRVSSLELVLIPMLEPIICPIWVFIFLKEIPGPLALVGAGVVILSVIIWSLIKIKTADDLGARKKPIELLEKPKDPA
jgi:drug/metabolite transporter (DMT)-like permease